MEKKNSFNITLAGKSYTLCGEESGEYLKSVGSYIENKYAEFSGNLAFRTQSMDMQHVLLQLNIADDYFKCREKLSIQMRYFSNNALLLKASQSVFDTLHRLDNIFV